MHAAVENVVEALTRKFPELIIEEDLQSPVEWAVNLPVQPGLKYKVWLCLQNADELHLQVGNFWCEWFPCTKPSKVSEYIDAVLGFLDGRYRILETYCGRGCVKAELQAPCEDGWKTIATWSTWNIRFPWQKLDTSIIQNIAE